MRTVRPAVFEEQGLPVLNIKPRQPGFYLRTPSDLEDKIIRLYREGDLNLRAVAAECGVSHQTAGNVLRRAGVKIEKRPRSRKWHQYRDEVLRLYVDEDRPITEIGRILSLIPADVSEALHSAGVEIKPGGFHAVVFPELRTLKVGESPSSPSSRNKAAYVPGYYIMAKKAGIKVSVRVADDGKVKVIRLLQAIRKRPIVLHGATSLLIAHEGFPLVDRETLVSSVIDTMIDGLRT